MIGEPSTILLGIAPPCCIAISTNALDIQTDVQPFLPVDIAPDERVMPHHPRTLPATATHRTIAPQDFCGDGVPVYGHCVSLWQERQRVVRFSSEQLSRLPST